MVMNAALGGEARQRTSFRGRRCALGNRYRCCSTLIHMAVVWWNPLTSNTLIEKEIVCFDRI